MILRLKHNCNHKAIRLVVSKIWSLPEAVMRLGQYKW